MERDVDAELLPDLARPHAGGADDIFSLDNAIAGAHAGDAALLGQYFLDLHILEDLDALHPRTLGERHRGVGRVALAVLGIKDAADHVLGVEERPFFLHARPVELDTLDLEALQHIGAAAEFFPARFRGRDRKGARLHETGRLLGFLLQGRVEIGCVFRELGEALAVKRGAHQAGRMPGRAGGQFLALQQHRFLAPAELPQMVGDRTTKNAATDDDDAGFCGK